MSDKPWADAMHSSYRGPKTAKCLGCGQPCARSAWGKWCFPCNVKRIARIDEQMQKLAKKIEVES